MSSFEFDRVLEWLARGVDAARTHAADFVEIARRQGDRRPLVIPSTFLTDSVRVTRVAVEGSTRPQVTTLVRRELREVTGAHVSPDRLAARLSDIDATGLFGLVRYRLDREREGVVLTVRVQERPKDRFGIGLRYDDERRAALLFTTTVHNLVRYGSVTRLDLRVGEETWASASYIRRHGITGRFEGGTTVRWSQSELRLPGPTRETSGLDLTTVTSSLGLVGGRTTFFGVELTGEWSNADIASVPAVLLFSGAARLDHESLDRVDFPRNGMDATARWEWGVTDIVAGESFSLLTASTRVYVPLHGRLTADLGAFVGLARGSDLPIHRTFYVGGQHASAVLPLTQPEFHGLGTQELTGTSAQIGRMGIRWEAPRGIFLRLGMDVGGAMDAWSFPIEDPVVGWALTLGAQTIVGPVVLEWGKASTASDGRLSIRVGRLF
jgi:outer membrane protein assembly factor BamA